MTPEQQMRMQALKDPWCSYGLIQELYGLDLAQDDALLGALRSWARLLRRPITVLEPERIHRHHLETFLQVEKLLPMKQAAARLGMDVNTLLAVERALRPQGFYITSPLSEQLAEESRLRSITRYLPEVRYQLFGDHDDFCSSVHEAIGKALGIPVQDLRCITSSALGESPPQYAYEFDVITLEPIGIRYQVWLDFGKPVQLKPDCCAAKTYVENKEVLQAYVFPGHTPRIPTELEHR